MDFSTLAKTKITELPTVKLLPRGTYFWIVDKVPEQKLSKSENGINTSVRLKLVRPIDNFEDPDALEEFGDPKNEVRTINLYVPTRAKDDQDEASFERQQARSLGDMVDFFMKKLGVEGDSVEELISSARNHMCLGTVTHKPDFNDPTKMVDTLEAKDCAPVEE